MGCPSMTKGLKAEVWILTTSRSAFSTLRIA
jgi:hypothetical protein